MAKHKLSETKIKTFSEPGIYGDGGCLFLRVYGPDSRAWVFIWRRQGIRHEIGLGSHLFVSLAAARVKAEEARAIVGAGGDPKTDMAERKAKAATTFGQLADEYVTAMKSKWRGTRTLPAWELFAKTYAKPMREKAIHAITTDDVVSLLQPLWHDKPKAAAKVREKIKLVLDSAKARGLRQGDNPAEWRGHLDQILPAAQKLANGHHAAMAYSDVPAFVGRLRAVEGVGARVLEFIVLTASRVVEATHAERSEFDLEKKIWTVPAERMKSGKEHRVPLTDRAVAIVTELDKTRTCSLVFEGRVGKRPISPTGIAKAMKAANGGDATTHGFRSSFRDWASEETQHQREVAEAALSHAVGDQVERAYRRSDALEKRRALMTDWATYLKG